MESRAQKRNRLWREYATTRNPETRAQLILDSAGVLKWAVGRVTLDLPPQLSTDALLDYAIQELFRVIDGPLPSGPAQFDDYLTSRVRRAILEGLRRSLGSGASIYRMVEPSLSRCVTEFREKGDLLSPAEMLGIDERHIEKQERLLAGMSLAALLLTLDLLSVNGGGEDDGAGALGAAISRLPQDERTLFALYHFEELTISEIGRVLKVSRSEVCALFTVATFHVLGQVTRVLIHISTDKMEATARVYPWAEGPGKGLFPGRDLIQSTLRFAGVLHGIDESTIAGLVSGPVPGRPVIIARGTEPVHGTDGGLERVFEDDGSGSNGWAKGRVKRGEPLARLVAATPGVPGTDVTGAVVPARDSAPPSPSMGANARMSEDGLSVCAGIDGQAWFDGQFAEVVPVLELDEAPEGRTTVFQGTIIVRGVVQSGSRIIAEWDVVAERIEGAQVAAGGDVVVHGGIVGCEEPGVRAAGSIRCRFVEASSVRAGGCTHIDEYMVHSTIEACASIDASRCWVCGGRVSSGAGVHLGLAGGDLGTRTVITAGDRRLVRGATVALHRVLRSGAPGGSLIEKFASRMVSMLESLPREERCTIRAETGVRAGVTLSIAGNVKFIAEDLGPGMAVVDGDGTLSWKGIRVH